MMKNELQIAVCEDEQIAYDRLISYIDETLPDAKVEHFTDGSYLVQSFFCGKYDLIFMDIYMEKMNGVETVELIRKTDADVPIAFLTSSEDHAMDGYRLHVERYIQKPCQKADVADALKLGLHSRSRQAGLTVTVDGAEETFPYRRIRYVEQDNHQLHIHLTGGRQVSIRKSINDFDQMLPHPPFLRCHKSFIVNMTQICNLDRELNVFEMNEGGNVYIRRESLKKAAEAFESFMFEQTFDD